MSTLIRTHALARRFGALLIAASSGFVALPALALQDRCVSNNTQLEQALQGFEEGEDTIIRLVQGTYAIRANASEFDTDLTLIGGYTDATCSARNVDPALTVLRPGTTDSVILEAEDISLNSLSFRDFGDEVSLQALGQVFANGRVVATRVRFDGPATRGNVLYADEVIATDLLVHSSGAPGDEYCALNIWGQHASDDLVSLTHSTVAHNNGQGVCIGRDDVNDDDGFPVRLDNNVFWNNVAVDLSLRDTSNHVRRSNTLSSASFEFPNAGGSGSLSFDPLFVNPAAQDFRLQNASTSINSGVLAPHNGLPQLDIAGNARLIGPAPDRGAYESGVTGPGQELLVTRADDDGGIGTLRWALNQANADPNYSVIRFNIPGACPRVIAPTSALPLILSPIGIAGYSQPGSQANTTGLVKATNATICVSLSGFNGLPYGLRLPQSAGTTAQLGVSGMAFSFFSEAGIALEAGIGSSVVGNQFLAGPIGVFVLGSAEQTAIGGAEPWQINQFGPSLRDYAIALNWPSTRTRVENNLIGLAASGNAATGGNGVGIGISSHENSIVDNAISGTTSPLALFDAHRNEIRDNVLGRKVGTFFCPGGCDLELANSSHGVLIQGASGDNRVIGNTIANSGGAGIRLTSGQRNSFVDNAIWSSGGLAIDLGTEGVDVIDNDGAASAGSLPNRGLNRPLIGLAGGGARRGTASGTLLSTNATYLVEAYASSGCGGPAQTRWPLGWALATITNAPAGQIGTIGFSVPLYPRSPAPSLVGTGITIVATEVGGSGNGNSSEVSLCSAYLNDQLFADDFQ